MRVYGKFCIFALLKFSTMDKDKINQIFDKFSNANVLVIGDVMIDCYISGKVTRISPEAPVPIVNAQSRNYRLGGAANVALNLKSLGAKPILCSVIGSDNKSKVLYDLMEECELDSLGLVPIYGRRTTVKYRIIGNNAHIVRVDDERDEQLKEREKRQFLTTVEQVIDHNPIDAIIFEDYDKGLFSRDLIEEIITFAHKKNIFIAVDPKKRNFNNYQNVNLFKPNMKELSAGLNLEDNVALTLENIHDLTKKFATEKNIDMVLITMSDKGMAFYDRIADKFYHQEAFTRRVSDPSGAGDTVISVSTLFLLSKESMEMTCLASNLAGGLVCEYVGVVPINTAQLKSEIFKNQSEGIQ